LCSGPKQETANPCKVNESVANSELAGGPGTGVIVKLTDLRGILNTFRNSAQKTSVIAVDATIVRMRTSPHFCSMSPYCVRLSIRVVVVHGAAEQIQALAEGRMSGFRLDGTGVTDTPTLQLALPPRTISRTRSSAPFGNDLRAACTKCHHSNPWKSSTESTTCLREG